MYINRVDLYKKLEKEFDSKLLLYVTSDRQNMSAQIASDVIDYFINQLDKIGPCKRLSLYLYTRGGNTSAAWNIVNLIRMYCDELQVIVPHKAHSAGTIISLGANEIVMTKQATLSPIDPSIKTPLNPRIPNVPETMPVSVEAVKGYIEFAREELGTDDVNAISNIFMKLTDYVHPLVLGEVYRSRAQIKMLAEKLLVNQVRNAEDVQKIVDFLCSESGSHDYTINRREAETDLKLKVRKPSKDQYTLIKKIYDDVSEELAFNSPFNPSEVNGEFAVRRSLLESIDGGSDYFVTMGKMSHVIGQNGEVLINEQHTFEGWRHDNTSPSNQDVRVIEDGGVSEYEASSEFQV